MEQACGLSPAQMQQDVARPSTPHVLGAPWWDPTLVEPPRPLDPWFDGSCKLNEFAPV